jgi:thiol-disulfide isomerase/thioredoxin
MARTESMQLPLGTPIIPFELLDVSTNKNLSLVSNNHVKWIMFISNHCPFVKHLHDGITKLAKEYSLKGVDIYAISVNDIVNYPDDAPEHMAALKRSLGWEFPYLYDESQDIARSYDAVCTPDFYIYDKNNLLFYHGQFDDSRPQNDIPVTGASLRDALDCALAESTLETPQKPSLGCNIKWKEN